MRILLLLSTLAFPPREPAPALDRPALAARVSVRADTDSVVAVGILNDIAAAFDEVARQKGFDRNEDLDGWLEPSYLAFPSKRPDVPEYFVKQEAYATYMEAHIDSIVLTVVRRRLEAAGIAPPQQDQMREAFLRGFNRSDAKPKVLLATMRRQARLALALHEFLLKVEPRVAIDPKSQGLVFERPLEKRRYHELEVAIDTANEELAKAAGQRGASRGAQR